MAASSEKNIHIEIKLNNAVKDELYISHGCTTHESTTIMGKKYVYKGAVNVEDVNGNTCLLTINFIEKTTNELGQICCRIKGNVVFRIVKLISRIGIGNTFTFEDVPVTNHCLDDEEYENAFLKDQRMKVIDKISGDLLFVDYFTVDDRMMKKAFVKNDIIESQYILPWRTTQIEALAPGGYLIPEISSYHVTTFRFVSGTALPFSYALYWQNRYFRDFEYNATRCGQFVDIIYGLLESSIRFHPEFSGVDDFVSRFSQMISEDKINHKHLLILDIIINMLNLKTASEPYITDEVHISKINRKVNVDQLSNVCEIKGCDCEDGAKYAYELKRLICESNWPQISKTLNGDVRVTKLMGTVVTVLNMTKCFFSVMYCVSKRPICHVVAVLVDNITADKLVGMQSSSVMPIGLLRSIKTLFVETTAYSSPFQSPYISDAYKKRTIKQRRIENCVSSSMHFKSTETYSSPEISDKTISPFYRIFVNMITTEYPGVTDFLPISRGNVVGFTLDDLHSESRDVRLVPRIKTSPALHSAMVELIENQLPSYIITPRDLDIIYDMYGRNAVGLIRSEVDKCISEHSNLKSKYIQSSTSHHYVRVNVYTVDIVARKSVGVTELMSKVENTLINYPFLNHFTYRIDQIYKNSVQTIVFNIFFYYDSKSQEVNTMCERSKHAQEGRFN
jgi:hypothetical protein